MSKRQIINPYVRFGRTAQGPYANLIGGSTFARTMTKAAADFYIDPDGGSDSNTGKSADQAWATWGKIATENAWETGKTYVGKGGAVARESIIPGADGVNIGSYGSGRHIASGADAAANASWTKTAGRTNVYQFTYTTAAGCVNMVWEDSARLAAATDLANCDATPGSFFHSAGVMYAHASDSSDISANGKAYEVPGRAVCLNLDSKSNCNVSTMEFIKAYSSDANYGNIRLSGNSNTLTGIHSHNCRRHALQFLDAVGATCQSNRVSGGQYYDVDASYVVSFFTTGSGGGTSDNILTGAEIYNPSGVDTEAVICHDNANNCVVELCNIHDVRGEQTFRVFDCSGFKVRNNTFSNLNPQFYFLLASGTVPGMAISGNTLNLAGIGSNIDLIFLNGVGITGNSFTQNTFQGAGGRHVLRLFNGPSNTTFQNNILNGNARALRVDAASQTGFVSDFNTFYNLSYATPFTWGTTEYDFDGWKTASGQDANSNTNPP